MPPSDDWPGKQRMRSTHVTRSRSARRRTTCTTCLPPTHVRYKRLRPPWALWAWRCNL